MGWGRDVLYVPFVVVIGILVSILLFQPGTNGGIVYVLRTIPKSALLSDLEPQCMVVVE
jgi:hypothetical protein